MRHVSSKEAKTPGAAVDGVVLAAGASRRMGTSKATLSVDDAAFITRAVAALRAGGCRDVVAVIRPEGGAAGTAASQAGARVVMNTAPDAEQIDSLRLALRNLLPGADGALVLPVDHPLVSAQTVAAVIAAFASKRPPIARASHAGVAGHPTLFGTALFEELLHGELPEGARSVIAAHRDDVLDVAVDDAGVTADIDTPDDLRRWTGGATA